MHNFILAFYLKFYASLLILFCIFKSYLSLNNGYDDSQNVISYSLKTISFVVIVRIIL